MLHVLRPKDGVLALGETASGKLMLLPGQKYIALPDVEFWSALRSAAIIEKMRKENPARMGRVERNGVGDTRVERRFVAAGLTLRDSDTKEPTPGTVDVIAEAVEEPIERER